MSAITHEIFVKKSYKIIQQILEPHYSNSSESEDDYKFITPDLEIYLVSDKPKETTIVISFPNHEYTINNNDLKISQLNTDRKKLAYYIQNEICKIYDILGKKYYESNVITLKWTNVSSWIPFIYPQFAFELTHNLPGKDFLENGSRFNAKFILAIYDKLLYNKIGVINENHLYYTIKIEILGLKNEDGVEIITSNYYHSNHNLSTTIIPEEYIDKTDIWLHKTCDSANKNNILCDFVTHIIQIMKENN